MQPLQTGLHSYSFCFQTMNREVKNFSILEFRTYKVEFETFVEEFPKKGNACYLTFGHISSLVFHKIEVVESESLRYG